MLISVEIPWRDPITAFSPFSNDPMAALLHGDGEKEMGRWSYIAASPFSVIRTDAALTTTHDDAVVPGDPFSILKDILSGYVLDSSNSPAPFAGGAVGFLSYELGRAIEQLPRPKHGADGPALVVGLFDVIAAFDHHTERAWVIASGLPEQDSAARQTHAKARADWLRDALSIDEDRERLLATGTWSPDVKRNEHEDGIARAIAYIHAGDIFQANITQRHVALKPQEVAPWDLFKSLRQEAPSPFGAFIAADESFHLLSASPERFLKVSPAGRVETRPIKGSRPRGKNNELDTALAQDLVSSSKDRAENLMIVDLMRNDLSRVCAPGSVDVPVLCGLETFPAIHHLVSVITGQLRGDQSAVDLLRACFPGGSVTGAPKVRAMEVIHELEPVARGPYCGAVVWLGFDGAMDSSIVIRSLVVDGDTVVAQAGGGIVADSEPALEYEEAMLKIGPLLSVLEPVEGR